MAQDQDALICDLAETYGIYDMRALPVETLAVLASGLRENSRIKQKMAGMQVSQDTALLAMAVDSLNFLAWSKTKSAQKNQNRPQSLARKLMGLDGKKSNQKTVAFQSGEDFAAEWNRIAGGGDDGKRNRDRESVCTDHSVRTGHQRKNCRSTERGG